MLAHRIVCGGLVVSFPRCRVLYHAHKLCRSIYPRKRSLLTSAISPDGVHSSRTVSYCGEGCTASNGTGAQPIHSCLANFSGLSHIAVGHHSCQHNKYKEGASATTLHRLCNRVTDCTWQKVLRDWVCCFATVLSHVTAHAQRNSPLHRYFGALHADDRRPGG